MITHVPQCASKVLIEDKQHGLVCGCTNVPHVTYYYSSKSKSLYRVTYCSQNTHTLQRGKTVYQSRKNEEF